MHSWTARSMISGFFLGNLFRPDTSIKIGMKIPVGYFLEITLADQNVKMAAIFQDDRHFEYQNIRKK